MSPYITDSHERRDIPLIIAGISVLASVALAHGLSRAQIEVPYWIDVTSVPFIYGLLFLAFDVRIWRLTICRTLKLVRVPDLNGEWTGYVLSNYHDFETKSPVILRIEQHWSRIRITLDGKDSTSFSDLVGVFIEAPEGIVLAYEYQNEPKPSAVHTMNIHRGTARLRLTHPDILDGEYYSGRGRKNFGHFHVARRVDHGTGPKPKTPE